MMKSELIALLADFDDNSEIWISDSAKRGIAEITDISRGPNQVLTDGSSYPVAVIWISE